MTLIFVEIEFETFISFPIYQLLICIHSHTTTFLNIIKILGIIYFTLIKTILVLN